MAIISMTHAKPVESQEAAEITPAMIEAGAFQLVYLLRDGEDARPSC